MSSEESLNYQVPELCVIPSMRKGEFLAVWCVWHDYGFTTVMWGYGMEKRLPIVSTKETQHLTSFLRNHEPVLSHKADGKHKAVLDLI